ncbi:MAG: S8 family serine peptidase [Desulfurococcaceae archaeon]
MCIFRVLLLLVLTFSLILYPQCLVTYSDISKNLEEVLIVAPNGKLELSAIPGCVVIRQYRYFNIVLATCPINKVSYLKQLGYHVSPNVNVSVSWVHGRLKILSFEDFQEEVVSSNKTYAKYWSWAISRTGVDLVWRYLGVNGSNAIIAVLDTGIDPTHPLLRDKVIGWIEFDNKGNPVCSKPHDKIGHGTWVSSIIAGGDTERYPLGVAPGAKLIVANIMPGGFGNLAQVLAGLEWALDPYDCEGRKLDLKPNIVSMSFGIDIAHDQAEYIKVFLNPISKLLENGIIPVAAIGNNGPYVTSSPGNIWGVIGSGSSDFNDNVAWFSSYGEVEYPEGPGEWPFKGRYPSKYVKPDFIAPGIDIPGAWPGNLLLIGSGTSASTAIISGITALLYSVLHERGFQGPLLIEIIYDILVESSIKSNTPGEGHGLVDAYYAVSRAMGLDISKVNISVLPNVIQPGFNAKIQVSGIFRGMNIDVYVSGVLAYSGVYEEGIDIFIPPTHRDGNIIAVIGDGVYGRGLIRVLPLMLTTSSSYPGGGIEIFASGLGIGDELVIYLENNVLSIAHSDLRGTLSVNLITPFLSEGYYKIKLIDRNYPYISIERRVYINPVIPETIPVSFYTEPYYLAGKEGFLYINLGLYKAILLDIKPVESNASMVKVLDYERVYMTLYRVKIYVEKNLSRDDIAILNAVISLGGRKYFYLFVIKLLPEDPIQHVIDTYRSDLEKAVHLYETKIDEINYSVDHKITRLMNNIALVLDNITERNNEILLTVNSVVININDLNRRIDDLNRDVGIVYIVALISMIFSIISMMMATLALHKKRGSSAGV